MLCPIIERIHHPTSCKDSSAQPTEANHPDKFSHKPFITPALAIYLPALKLMYFWGSRMLIHPPNKGILYFNIPLLSLFYVLVVPFSINTITACHPSDHIQYGTSCSRNTNNAMQSVSESSSATINTIVCIVQPPPLLRSS